MPTSRLLQPLVLLAISLPLSAVGTGVSDVPGATLEAGAPASADLSGGEVRSFRVVLRPGWTADLDLEQRGIDLVLVVQGEDGAPALESDTTTGGLERLTLVGRAGSPVVVTVRTRHPDAAPGAFTLRLLRPRPAAPADMELGAAQAALVRALALIADGQEASLREARPLLDAAVPVFEASGDLTRAGLARREAGVVQQLLGDELGALERLERAAAALASAGDRAARAEVATSMGASYKNVGAPAAAIACYEEALRLYAQAPSPAGEGITLNNLARVHDDLGDFTRALALLREALARKRAAGDRQSVAVSLHNLGLALNASGDKEGAFGSLEESLAISRSLGNIRGQAHTSNGLGFLYESVGLPERALALYADAEGLARKMGNERLRAVVLHNMAVVQRTLGQADTAQQSFREALALSRKLADADGEARALYQLAIGDLRSGALEEARRAAEESQRIFERIGQTRDSAWSWLARGLIAEKAGDRDEAVRALRQACDVASRSQLPRVIVTTSHYLARALIAQGRLDEARDVLLPALEVAESVRGSLARPETRASFFATQLETYRLAIDLLLRRPGQEAEAFHLSERSRARTLLDLLAESRVDIRAGVDGDLVALERDARRALSRAADRRLRLSARPVGDPGLVAAEKEVKARTVALEEVQGLLRTRSPRYAALTQPRPLRAGEVAAALRGQEAVVLEFSLGEERSHLFTVSARGLSTYVLPAKRTIDEAALRLQRALREEGGASLREASAEVGRLLLGPVAHELGKRPLLIVADGALHYVPFALLPVPGTARPLVEDHEITYLPSVSVMPLLPGGERAAPLSVAVFADPLFAPRDRTAPPAATVASGALDRAARQAGLAGPGALFPSLPGSRQEARKILSLFAGGTARGFLGEAATKQAFLDPGLSAYRYLHVATHGVLNEEEPALSGLVLSLADSAGRPLDGFLKVADVFNVRLSADMAVLSACQTALGKDVQGEGLMGLTQAFFYAGASRVVASLFRVGDAATAVLMERLYDALLHRHLGPAAALRAAQLSMSREARWRDPRHWGGFVLQGDWR